MAYNNPYQSSCRTLPFTNDVSSANKIIQLPEWLVDEKTGGVRESLATTFVGRISRKPEEAVLFRDSSPGRRLMRIAHEIHFEHGVENTAVDSDRRRRLNDPLQVCCSRTRTTS
jgi:hypothetical protein